MSSFIRLVVLSLASLIPLTGTADFRFEIHSIDHRIHALIGPTTDRTYENHGLNANFGVIDTPDGAILIDSGASAEGAALLAEQAEALTGKPVRWVINTGAQDHRWLGNSHFINQDIEVIGHARTIATQRAEVNAQLERLRPVLLERMDGTEPVHANHVLRDTDNELILGGRRLVIKYLADAHFPGDVVVWLPDEGILFAGDHVYANRLLSIRRFSKPAEWLTAFEKIEALAPNIIVPGHGHITDLSGARATTGDYLAFIVEGVSRLADEMAGVEAAVESLLDAPAFSHLENFDALHRQNIIQAYLQAEAGF